MQEIEVSIYSIVGNGVCMDAEDGEKVFKVLKKILEQNNKAPISFSNVELMTPTFLNTAIGRLYGLFPHERIKKSLTVKDISADDKLLLKKVTGTAKAYYKNKSSGE